MKPEKGRGSEQEGEMEGDQAGVETEQLAEWVGMMVLEARGPGRPKPCQEGPHCPLPQARHAPHVCSLASRECRRAEELRKVVERSLRNKVPIFIDVVLFPSCPHGQAMAAGIRPHFSLVKEPAILLERWTLSVDQKRHMGEKVEGVGSTFGLMNAVRSQLYFSQLSSWIQTHSDGLPLSVAYRVSAPGEAGLQSFIENPVTKTLPTVDFKSSFLRVSVSELPRKEDNSIILLQCAEPVAQTPEVPSPRWRQWKEFEDKPSVPEGAASPEWPLQGRPGSAAVPRSQHPGISRPMSFVQDGDEGIRFKQRSTFAQGDVARMGPGGAAVKNGMRRDLTSPLEKSPSAGLVVPKGSSTMKRLYSPSVLVTSDQDGVVTQYEHRLPDASYCLGSLEMTQSTKAGLLLDDDAFRSSSASLDVSPWDPLQKSPYLRCPSPEQDSQYWTDRQGSSLCPPQPAMKSRSMEEKLEYMRKVKAWNKVAEDDFELDAEDGILPSEESGGIDFYLGDEDLPQAQSRTSNTVASVNPTCNTDPCHSSVETPQQNSCTNNANQSGNKTSSWKKRRNRRKKRGRREEPEQKDEPSVAEQKLRSKPLPASPPVQMEEKHPQERKPQNFKIDKAPPRSLERISRKDIPRNSPDSLAHSRNARMFRRLFRDMRSQERGLRYKSKEAEHLGELAKSRHCQDSKRRKSTSSELEPERWQKLKQEGDLNLASTPPIQLQPAPQTGRPQESAQRVETPSNEFVSALVDAVHGVVSGDLVKKNEEDDDDDDEFEVSSLDEDSDIEPILDYLSVKSSSWSENGHQGAPCDGDCKCDPNIDPRKWFLSPRAPALLPHSASADPGSSLPRKTGSRSRDSHSNIPEFNKDSAVCLYPSDDRTVPIADSEQERAYFTLPDDLIQHLLLDSDEERETDEKWTREHKAVTSIRKLLPKSGSTESPSSPTGKPTEDVSSTAKPLLRNEPVSLGTSNGFATEEVSSTAKPVSLGTSNGFATEELSSTAKLLLRNEPGSLGTSNGFATEEVSSTAIPLQRNEPGSLGTSNGFATHINAGTNCMPSEKSVATRKSQGVDGNLTQKSQQITTCSRDADDESHRIYWTESSSLEHSRPSTRNTLTERGQAEDFAMTLMSQEKPARHREETLECPGPEETPGLKSDQDPVSLNSSLETLVGSLPKGEYCQDTKGDNSRATFYELDDTGDGDLSELRSTVLKEFTTKDDLSALFLAKRPRGEFGNDGEVNDEVFAKSSPPSPVKLGPGREEDVLLRSSPSKGGRTNLKRPRSESSKLPEVLSAVEACAHRQYLRKSHSLVFNGRTALPSQSSPAPVKRKSMSNFGFDVSLTKPRAISSALSCSRLASDEDQEEGEDNRRTLSTSAPASTNCLLGNFEESVLNGRIEPMGIVEGFTAEIGASGSFCPKHRTLPVTAYFFKLSDDNAPSPYLGHINLLTLGKKGYHVPKKGTVQVTLFNPSKTVVKMFVVLYDLSEMPPHCQTFLRQRTLYQPADSSSGEPSFLRYLIHLRFASSGSGRVYLHTDIRLIFARDKFELDSKVSQYELRSFTECPKNPKFSRRR